METARLAKDSHTKKIANTKNQDSRILRESARDLGKTPKESIVYLSRTTASGMEIPLEGPKNSNYGKIDRRRKKVSGNDCIYTVYSYLLAAILIQSYEMKIRQLF